MVILFTLSGICLGVGIWQLAVWLMEIRRKNQQCQSAVDYCKKRNKLLLVAGGPWGGRKYRLRWNTPAHTMGDVAIDISANAIKGHPLGVVADVMNLPFPDKTFGAAFASHLLEHIPSTAQAAQALAELDRVADATFIASPSRQSLPATLIRGHHLWVWQKKNTIYLKQRGQTKPQNKIAMYNLTNNVE